MRSRTLSGVGLLLFGSGFCALVYQVAWLRHLRLVFGASTAASAAVLAIFMGGLGLGGLWLGRRADGWHSPLAAYGGLEAGVALLAALSPLTLLLVRTLYLAAGGTFSLGPLLATGLRLTLAALALLPPTLLMGGTLPAAARAVTGGGDLSRRGVAFLYGANTLGSVVGALVTTFWALEHLGIDGTVWSASALNLLVAATAVAAGRGRRGSRRTAATAPAEESEPFSFAPSPPGSRGVFAAAFGVGFVFFLMELVWYRMLAPVLGGSSYTFGLILATALLGVGLGGWLYSRGREERRPSLGSFAVSCSLQALAMAAPFALGDRLAELAILLRPLGQVSFGLLVGGWSLLCALVVLPASVVAGYQFPLLLGVVGAGDRQLGRQVGLTYAWNTAGAIVGAVSGGFGLLAWLTAPGAWMLSASLLVLLALAALGKEWLEEAPSAASSTLASGAAGQRRRALASGLAALVLLAAAEGPTAVWRHSPIGAGGMPATFGGPNDVRFMESTVRRAIFRQTEGVESSIGLHGLNEIVFLINGKADGSALTDAPTQVMSGLIGAALHPAPRRALVVGLGSGSSAGWLAEVPTIERVDVVELEPAMLEVARLCGPVSHHAVEHPKVSITLGDGRELLLTTPERYDLIFSEPSNPYRAGIASLFTREFYQAAANRLKEGGIFLQWLQGYDVDAEVVRTAYATLGAVFGSVESWQVHSRDLLLVASQRPLVHDVPLLRRRMASEPWRSALRSVLRVDGLEGFYTGFVARPGLARALGGARGVRLNTDDRPIMEFGFARGLGRRGGFSLDGLRQLAAARGEDHPLLRGGGVSWERVEELRTVRDAAWGVDPSTPDSADEALGSRVAARRAYLAADLPAARRLWASQAAPPETPLDRLLVAEALAEHGDEEALAWAERLDSDLAAAGEAIRARLRARQGALPEAAAHLEALFEGARQKPWIYPPLLARSLSLAVDVGSEDPVLGEDLYRALGEPFAVRSLDETRLRARFDLARSVDAARLCVESLAAFEPHVPWEESFLRLRLDCYRQTGHPLLAAAAQDLDEYDRHAPPRLVPSTRP